MNTIVALATPLGRSGIGVIRLSGEASLEIARKLVGDASFAPEPRRAYVKQLCNAGDVIDEAVVTFFEGPRSFTGEDVLEISCHGSPVLLRQVIDICLAADARMADPGEFSLRALSNGRIDLAEAEAIRDLIHAQTFAAARQAVRQMRGELSDQLQPIKDELLDVIVLLESALEFVEDDLPENQVDAVRGQLISISSSVGKMAATFRSGNLIREGIRVAIVGRPNVGKSSLFNALLGNDRAIVTNIAGTTRDQIHEKFTIDNIPISLIDTAGLRETTDTVERIGVGRSRRTMADADVVVVMLDVSDEATAEDIEILRSISDLRCVVVVNKIDKVAEDTIDDYVASFEDELLELSPMVRLSAKTGAGLELLRRALVDPFAPEDLNSGTFLVADARHHDLLVRTGEELQNSAALLAEGESEEIVLVGLHNALRYLGEITGETTTEEMLTRIFATFCIGK